MHTLYCTKNGQQPQPVDKPCKIRMRFVLHIAAADGRWQSGGCAVAATDTAHTQHSLSWTHDCVDHYISQSILFLIILFRSLGRLSVGPFIQTNQFSCAAAARGGDLILLFFSLIILCVHVCRVCVCPVLCARAVHNHTTLGNCWCFALATAERARAKYYWIHVYALVPHGTVHKCTW